MYTWNSNMRKKSRQGHKIDDTEMESSRVLGNSAELSKTFLLLPILILAQLNLGKMQFLLLSRSQSKTYVQSLKSSSWVLGAFSTIWQVYHFQFPVFFLAVFFLCLHFFSCRSIGSTELTVAERKTKQRQKTAKIFQFFFAIEYKAYWCQSTHHLCPKWLCLLESRHMSNGATHGGSLPAASAVRSFPEWMDGHQHRFAPKIPLRQKYFPPCRNTTPRPLRSHPQVGTPPDFHCHPGCSACFEAVSFIWK